MEALILALYIYIYIYRERERERKRDSTMQKSEDILNYCKL